MTDPGLRKTEWRPAPGERVRLRMPLDRPRALDGKTGFIRYFWPGASAEYPWLVSLDRPVIDGRRAYTLVLCASIELEQANDARGDERGGTLGRLLATWRSAPRGAASAGAAVEHRSRTEAFGNRYPGGRSNSSSRAGDDPLTDRPDPEIVTYRWRSEFVGRSRETAQFAENLALPFDDERRKSLYNVVGPSGVGKTWLLRRFAEIFRRNGGLVLCADDSDADVVGVVERIAGQLAAHGRAHDPLEDALRRYRQSIRQSYAVDCPLSIAVSPPLVGYHDGHPELPGTQLALDAERRPIAHPMTLDLMLSEMDGRVARAADPRPLHGAIREITPLFVEALGQVASERPIALLFDGYERCGPYLDAWLRSILAGEHGDLPGATMVVVAGRIPLDATLWNGFESIMARVDLGPWTDDEARAYLLHHWILDERVVRTIQQVSGRLPVLVATMAVRANDRTDRLVQSDRNALDCFLTSLGDPTRRAIAVDASVPRLLDVDVLAQVIEGSERGPVIDWLCKMPFVEQRGSAWTYRPAVREVLLRYLRAESPGRWLELHERVATYYERLADALDGSAPSRLRDVTAQAYETEALYHRLCQCPPAFLASALNGFVGRFGGEMMLARRWAETIRQAGHDAADGATERWGDRLVEAVDAFVGGRFEVAAKAFAVLGSFDGLEWRARRAALAWRARLLAAAGRIDLAIGVYDRLVEYAPDRAAYWAERASALLHLGRHRDARRSLDRAIELDPNNVDLVQLRTDVDRLAEGLDRDPESSTGGAAAADTLDQGYAATDTPGSARSSADIERRAATATR